MSGSVTVRELIASLQALPPSHQDRPVKVWLPGSRISLSRAGLIKSVDLVMIEGNVDEGSALA